MSQLNYLKQRIKSVTTIKKITSVMRLISRSFHTQMHKETKYIHNYIEQLSFLYAKLNNHDRAEKNAQKIIAKNNVLYIIIGSQKGLCGSFNTPITHWIEKHKKIISQPHVELFVLSKKIDTYLQKTHIISTKTFQEAKLSNLEIITNQIMHIIQEKKMLHSIIIVSNNPKNFFSYECKALQIMPFNETHTSTKNTFSPDYEWNHDPKIIFEKILYLYIKNNIYAKLFISLSCEQSARFIAMDNATRNAQNILDTMKLQFNKIRQAKITKELAELAGAFESQENF